MYEIIKQILEDAKEQEVEKVLILMGMCYNMLLNNQINNKQFMNFVWLVRKYLLNEDWYEVCYDNNYEVKALDEIIVEIEGKNERFERDNVF